MRENSAGTTRRHAVARPVDQLARHFIVGYGSIEAYLDEELGVGPEQVAVLRRNLLQ